MKFEYIATKGYFPKRLNYLKRGVVESKSCIRAYKKLIKRFRNVQIVRRID